MKVCQLYLKRKMLGRFQDTANPGETSKICGQDWTHQCISEGCLNMGSVYTRSTEESPI